MIFCKCHSRYIVSVINVTNFCLSHLVMHIGYVPLQVSLEIAAVPTVGAFEVFHLDNYAKIIVAEPKYLCQGLWYYGQFAPPPPHREAPTRFWAGAVQPIYIRQLCYWITLDLTEG